MPATISLRVCNTGIAEIERRRAGGAGAESGRRFDERSQRKCNSREGVLWQSDEIKRKLVGSSRSGCFLCMISPFSSW